MEQFDYIIVGAGAAGPVLAARLTEDPTVSVVLLEAGGENTDDVGRMQGAFFHTWSGAMNWRYRSTPQPQLADRVIDQPRGRVMGGSTAINVGAWLRGCAADYDAWEAAGATGWNWQAALAVYRAIEDTDRGPNAWRGRGGPIAMQDLPTPTPFSEQLLHGFTHAGFGERGDANGESPYVADRYQTLFPDGVRRTPADAYLDADARARPNLRIVTDAMVTGVRFEGTRARGVTFTQQGEARTLACRREVILCAGAFNTPQLLMLSGIGPRDELDALGIPCVADVPGVGRNLQDHLLVSLRGLAPAGVHVSYPFWAGPAEIEQWLQNRSGPALYWAQNGVGFVRTSADSPGPDIELMFQYNPDLSNGAFEHVPDAQARSGFTVAVILLQPHSRGRLRLASADPLDAPVIDPAYLSDPRDAGTLIQGMRAAQKIVGTAALRPFTQHLHPPADAGDDALLAWIRADAGIAFHPAGTARMGALDDPLTVVDASLRVRGVEGLRVCDASVFPSLIRGHTMAPTVFVAERLGQMVRGERG